MNDRRNLLTQVYDRLFSALGRQHWWPADSPFEVVVGAILTQNTAWRNVKRSIAALRERGLLEYAALSEIPAADLAPLIRSSGYYNQKALKLRAFCDHVREKWAGSFEHFLRQEAGVLRSELLGIRGIGPETADSIVLYAAFKPSFVVDAYTLRIFSRHGWVPEKTAYEDLRRYFMDALARDVPYFQEYHALLVRTGYLYCGKKPACGDCPLKDMTEDESSSAR